MADIPKAGTFVHVLIEPSLAGGQAELLHQADELGVKGSEEGDGSLQDMERHEGVRREAAVELIEAGGEKREEAADGVGRRSHGGGGGGWRRAVGGGIKEMVMGWPASLKGMAGGQ